MIPVNSRDAYIVDIEKEKFKDYYLREIRYLRSPAIVQEIIRKIDNMYTIMNDSKNKDYNFFNNLCCNFKLLEDKCKEWLQRHNK